MLPPAKTSLALNQVLSLTHPPVKELLPLFFLLSAGEVIFQDFLCLSDP
jgi:hypothetical protein